MKKSNELYISDITEENGEKFGDVEIIVAKDNKVDIKLDNKVEIKKEKEGNQSKEYYAN